MGTRSPGSIELDCQIDAGVQPNHVGRWHLLDRIRGDGQEHPGRPLNHQEGKLVRPIPLRYDCDDLTEWPIGGDNLSTGVDFYSHRSLLIFFYSFGAAGEN